MRTVLAILLKGSLPGTASGYPDFCEDSISALIGAAAKPEGLVPMREMRCGDFHNLIINEGLRRRSGGLRPKGRLRT